MTGTIIGVHVIQLPGHWWRVAISFGRARPPLLYGPIHKTRAEAEKYRLIVKQWAQTPDRRALYCVWNGDAWELRRR